MSRSRGLPGRWMALAAVGSLMATAACGSTAQSTGADALGGGSLVTGGDAAPGSGDGLGRDGLGGDGLGGDGLAMEGPAAADSGGAFTAPGSSGGSSTSGGSAGSVGTPGSGSDGAGQASGSGGGTRFASGPGVTATSISLGLIYCGDCAAADAALGAGGDNPSDTRPYYKAALDEVNNRGGVLGRKLVPVWHQISAADSVDASAQAACETFTKDNKVAVIFFRTEVSYECAKKAGIIVVGQGGSGPLFERYPNLFAPGSLRLELLGAATVKGMAAAGWHKPEPKWPTGKIGLITWQNSDYEFAMKQGWLPALRESGLEATDVAYIAVPQSDKSIADSSAAINAAILSFRDKGVDHVFIADGPAGIFRGGGLTLQFLNAAKSQRYYPRYGFNSNNAPGDPALPADQQVGMMAINSNDLERANDEGVALNPQRERCYEVMKKKDLRVTDGNSTGITAITACGTAWFTEAVFKRATAGTTLPQVIAAAESLGTSYRSPSQYGTRIGPGRHDGDSFFRNASFNEACSCMKYTSKPYEP